MLLGAPEADWENAVEFVLSYDGPLRATQREPRQGQPPKHADLKRAIRAEFHHQLKELWRVNPALKGEGLMQFTLDDGTELNPTRLKEDLANKHQHYGKRFVPLVTEELDLLCSLDILFLRRDRPGGTVYAGDLDNRIKTLIDCLRIPEAGEGYSDLELGPDYDPFFVLLEEDKLLTKVSIETDRLYRPVTDEDDNADARLFIKVRIKPYNPNILNTHLG
ncbi:MAG TPA: hypothetical protein VGE68_00605 [Sphingomicrobium sp.]